MSFFFPRPPSKSTRTRNEKEEKQNGLSYRDQQLSRQQALQRHEPAEHRHLPQRGAQVGQPVRREGAAQRVDDEQRRGGGGAREVVGQRVVEAGGDVRGVEGAVGRVEGDVAKGHHGVGEHDEDLFFSGISSGEKKGG